MDPNRIYTQQSVTGESTSSSAPTPSASVAPNRSGTNHPALAGEWDRGAPLESLLERLRRDVADAVRVVVRAREDLGELLKYARRTGAPGLLRGAERLARQRPAVFMGGALILGFAALRALRRLPSADRARANLPLIRHHFDENRMPQHDRPSGYFSARLEGSRTNTPPTRTVLEWHERQ